MLQIVKKTLPPNTCCFLLNQHWTAHRVALLQWKTLQRGRKSSGLLQRKCFKWQLTASGLWNGCWVFWQNSILSAPLLLAGSFPLKLPFPATPLPNPSCCPPPPPTFFLWSGYENMFRCRFFYLQPPQADSRCLSPDECVYSSNVYTPTEEIKLSTEQCPEAAFLLLCVHTLSPKHTPANR